MVANLKTAPWNTYSLRLLKHVSEGLMGSLKNSNNSANIKWTHIVEPLGRVQQVL